MDDQTLHHFMQDLGAIITGVAFIIAAAWVVAAIIAAWRHRINLRAQTELINRLLEKFSTAEEFAAYLGTEAGRRFFENVLTERVTPMAKILGSIQKGAILTLLGAGLLALGNIFSQPQGGDIMIIIGVVALTIGFGFLVSAVVAYRLAKAWGLTKSNHEKNARLDFPAEL
jgi:ApbE superfamily uncharacterized protein (UPF0280 family)